MDRHEYQEDLEADFVEDEFVCVRCQKSEGNQEMHGTPMGIPRDELLRRLRQLVRNEVEKERAHRRADALILAFINDPEIQKLYQAVPKWFA